MSVHHAKEIDELKLIRTGWKGKAASLLERLSGKFVVSRSRAIIGVTREIAEYERDLHQLNLPVHEFPNGIDETQISILKDKRISSELNIAFMCGTFSAWHGLDLLIDSVDAVSDQDVLQGMRFHLIGTVPEPLLKRV
jgi:glycosyltransferase involved in cell wall biosynthesis